MSAYRRFLIENGDKLKQLPALMIARNYYLAEDRYLLDLDSGLVRGVANEDPREVPCQTLTTSL